MIRHGETDWNRRHALQGRLNTPLNANGIAQAQAAHEKMTGVRFDAVYASPLQRAVTTASIAAGVVPAKICKDARLTEIAFGVWEGLEMASLGDAFTPFFDAPEQYIPPENGEDFSALLLRTGEFLQMIQTQHAGECVLAASHGAATAALLLQVRGLPLTRFWATPVHNCQIFKLTAENGQWLEANAAL
ncbi:MAG: histidine phosphatase family protein [Ruthenibacterium sp.]